MLKISADLKVTFETSGGFFVTILEKAQYKSLF